MDNSINFNNIMRKDNINDLEEERKISKQNIDKIANEKQIFINENIELKNKINEKEIFINNIKKENQIQSIKIKQFENQINKLNQIIENMNEK